MRILMCAALVALCAGCGMTLPPRTAFVTADDAADGGDTGPLTDAVLDADGSSDTDVSVQDVEPEVVPDVVDAFDADALEVSEVSDVLDVSDLPDVPDVADVPDATEGPEVSDVGDDACVGECVDSGDVAGVDVCLCGDKTCVAACGESLGTCSADCAACGDGVCSPGEDPKSCAQDCCGNCGDDECRCTETVASCVADCLPGCGDGLCATPETKVTCPTDCGSATQVCGDGVCEPGDGGAVACPQDCDKACGNCSCQPGEDYLNCPVDCGYCGDGICSLCSGSGETLGTCPADCKGPDDGTCKGIVCDDGNVCTGDSCVPGQGCSYTPLAGSCNDNNACTVADACGAGICLPGAATTCDDLNPCTTDSCDPIAGCQSAPAATNCDDGNACTEGDVCSGAVCVGQVKACTDGNPCTDDSCTPTTGCAFQANAAPCDDANPCTKNDACAASACSGNVYSCTATDPCHDVGVCLGDGTCSTPAKADGAPCDDANLCTGGDKCLSGACAAGTTAVQCDDGEQCTTDNCVPATGCTHAAATDGTKCSDGVACTTDDACFGGACKATGPVCGNTVCECGESAANCAGDCNGEPPMVILPAGTFMMGSATGVGSSDEHPAHEVTLSAFAIDKSEVTVAQYQAFYDQLPAGQQCTSANSAGFGCGRPGISAGCNWSVAGKEQHPANCTDWFQAQAYCAWAHKDGRLVTEAEFEYAARSAGKNQTYPWGDAPPTCVNMVLNEGGIGCGVGGTWPVCSKTPGNSSQGACDLVGNVVEWCADWYGSYAAAPQTNPTGAASGTQRIVRSGSFYSDNTLNLPRSAVRNKNAPSSRYWDYGFRCAKTMDLCAGVTCPELACATQACDATTGKCVATPKADGLACNDGSVCTTGDTCLAGVCGAQVNCDDGNDCTTDSCSTLTGCAHVNVSGGTACGAGGTCSGGGTCDTSVPAGMVLIPAGTFWMGCNSAKDSQCAPDESPQHKVTLSAFYMDATETTVGQYKACVDAGGCTAPGAVQSTKYANYPGLTQNPVNFVTWAQMQTYCKWRGAGFDLPTEAQGELAARGSCEKNGSNAGDPGCPAAMRTYPWGETAASCSYAVMKNGPFGCGTDAHWPVGSKTAGDSPYGVHDLTGSVWEWRRDWYSATYYGSSPTTEPLNTTTTADRSDRGGGFGTDDGNLRGGARSYITPDSARFDLGGRCVKTADLCAGVSCPELACATQACDATTGKCVATPKADGLACNDGLVCTTGDTCLAGVCGAQVSCDDGNDCTTDSCSTLTGCAHVNVSGGTACGAGGTCSGGGTCDTSVPAGMVLIPAGTFWMGCNSAKDSQCAPDESPQHKVTLSAYYIDLTETTAAQYKACVEAGKCSPPDAACTVGDYGSWGVAGKEQTPLNCPTWTQSQQYCQWRGAGFDLPTEAQWEMAARGSCEKNGSSASDPGCATAMRTYPWGEALPSCTYTVFGLGNDGCGTGLPWAVGQKTAGDSPYGVHDLAGNVWEWTRDWYATAYTAGTQTDPVGPISGTVHGIRGGSFGTADSDLRSSRRDAYSPSSAYGGIGLRCARTFDLCAGVSCPELACATQACDANTGKCVATPKSDGLACNDGLVCTTGDTCLAGVCGTVVSCDDGNACTTDSCAAATGCVHATDIAGAACGTGGTCDGAGSCKMDAPLGMVLIPAASFWMGCNSAKDTHCSANENPQHKVTLSSYYMDANETTVGHYKVCVDAGACTAPMSVQPVQYATYPGQTDSPVVFVSWNQAQVFCKWRGAAFDLPTEAQWEMAARGSCEKNGSTAVDPTCAAAMRTYPWGEAAATCTQAVIDEGGWGCGTNQVWPVGSKPAGDSPYGLHDMVGNVWELTRDWYAGSHTAGAQVDPLGPASGTQREFGGGAMDIPAGAPYYDLRASSREYIDPVQGYETIGFRCMRTGDLCAGVTCPDLPCSTQTCDPSNGKCVPATKFNGGVCSVPSELSNLAIWFDASDATTVLSATGPNTAAADGQSIVKWLDKSGSGADASTYVGYAGPVFTANVASGKPVARFTGTAKTAGQMLVGTGSVGASAVTLIAVYAYRSLPVPGSSNFGTVVDFGVEPGLDMLLSCNQTPQAFAGYAGAIFNEATLPTLNQFRSESVVYDQSNVQAFLNGVSMGAAQSKSGITLDTQFILGAHRYYYNAGNNGWEYFANADIAEVILYKRALSASERAAVEGYLKVKYNLP